MKPNRKQNRDTPQREAWFIVWDDGEIHPGWGYTSVRELKEHAPGLVTGKIATWDDLKRLGLRYVRCAIVPTALPKK